VLALLLDTGDGDFSLLAKLGLWYCIVPMGFLISQQLGSGLQSLGPFFLPSDRLSSVVSLTDGVVIARFSLRSYPRII